MPISAFGKCLRPRPGILLHIGGIVAFAWFELGLFQLISYGARAPPDGVGGTSEQGVFAGRHDGNLSYRRVGLRGDLLGHSCDTSDYLPRVQAAFGGKALPMAAFQMIPSLLSSNLLCHVFRDVLPDLTAHHVV